MRVFNNNTGQPFSPVTGQSVGDQTDPAHYRRTIRSEEWLHRSLTGYFLPCSGEGRMFLNHEIEVGEVISVELEATSLKLWLVDMAIAIYAPLTLEISGAITHVDPMRQTGELAPIWSLVSRTVVSADDRDGRFELVFDHGRLVCPFLNGLEHVNIWGPGDAFTVLPRTAFEIPADRR
jgi:hypothetical protein